MEKSRLAACLLCLAACLALLVWPADGQAALPPIEGQVLPLLSPSMPPTPAGEVEIAPPRPTSPSPLGQRHRHSPYPQGIETLPAGWAVGIALAIIAAGTAAATALWLKRLRHSRALHPLHRSDRPPTTIVPGLAIASS